MNLGGQAGTARRNGDDEGYAMAVLLVALAVMAIMMTVAMPVWKQAAQREKEEELIFRGQQYVHALALFGRKFANAAPPNINVLVEQRFLRKKFKDPITNDDFQPILAGQNMPGAPTPGAPATPGGASTPGGAATPSSPQGGRGPTTISTGPTTVGGVSGASPFAPGGATGQPGITGGATGGIIGVTSKSKDKSLRLYNGRNHYNEWAFVLTQQTQAPGVGVPGTMTPGGRGQPGQFGQPGQRGQPQRGGPTSPFGGRGPGSPDGRGRGGPGRGLGGGASPFPTAPTFPTGRGRSGG